VTENRLKIVFLLNCFDISGVETIIAKTIRGLDPDRYDIRAIALQRRSGALADLLSPLGVHCVDVDVRSRFDFRALYRLARLIRGADVLHTATFHAHILGRLLGRFLGVPVILGSEVIMAFETPLRLALNRWTAWIPSYLICNAEAVRRYVIDTLKVPADRAVTVYQGVNVEAYPFRRERRFAHPVLGTVGRLQSQKGYRYLIEAAVIVRRTHANARWIWIGDGPERPQVEELISMNGLDGVIELAGYSGDMAENLTRFDYYVHPAIAEGMPYAVVEAMAAGLPVVATDVGGTRELVEHGVSGFVVPPSDPETLAANILALLEDPEGARRLGVAARERIRLHFPEGNMAEEEDRLIRQCFSAHRG